MHDIACGILGSIERARAEPAHGRARDLTVSWLRWNYFGEIFEAPDVPAILRRARAGGHRHCLVQAYGHIATEHAGPHGGRAVSFFDALAAWLDGRDFVFAGLPGRCLLADLEAWTRHGEPAVADAAPVAFGPALAAHLIDLGPDLSAGGGFLRFLDEMCEKAGRGVFPLNYESYDDVAGPPPGFHGPVSVLYCVAAGLKPNRILQTHGFDSGSRVVFFDYSRHALDFRRRLDAQWDGRDYPAYLRGEFERRDGTHFYLWPGATPEEMDWAELERLWAAELARWGGAEAFARHWRSFQDIGHDYLPANILAPDALLARIEDRPGSAIWWSNAFCTIYSAAHHSLEDKRCIYGDWIARLADKAPGLFLYGSDHSNSSVNGFTARDYHERYRRDGGDPLTRRAFHRNAIRF